MSNIEIIENDNIKIMLEFLTLDRKFDLVYMDPPFNTGREFRTSDNELAYIDRFCGLPSYVNYIANVTSTAWSIIKDGGYLVLHIDPTTSHYLKVECDKYLKHYNFFAEIIWRYRRWPTKTPNFQKMHDVLLLYRKGDKGTWNQLYEPVSESTRKTWGTKKQKAVFENGHRVISSIGEEESNGAPLSDVWDISIIAPIAKERTGYPTQKPKALLERLIAALTNPGDTVLDPFMGSGTTLEVARDMRRHAVGIDNSPVAIKYAKERLNANVRSRSPNLSNGVGADHDPRDT